MLKSNSEIIEEVDEDLQLQAGLQLSDEERQYLVRTGMLFMDNQRLKPYLSSLRSYLQNTCSAERVWTLLKVRDITNNQLAYYILSVAVNLQDQGE
ncbi:hypothetical protein LMB81_07325 [Limosilactobacillus reuteri]|uniref:hypothetical protein n=1 Tax=Limosilactobacillus reuteri TaxID=1598 RepID=UPI001E28DC8F|nr:hypothetical protein [Limosilactobacillus reuteri]MCC4491306.1 hypothetical protein [Limosilactobacillus reuteri]